MRILLFVTVALLFFSLLVFATGRQVSLWLKTLFTELRPGRFSLFFGLFCLVIIALFIVSRVPNNPLPRLVHQLTHYYLGLFVYLAMTFILLGLLLFLLRLTGLVTTDKLSHLRLLAGSVAMLLTLGFFFYGSINAKRISTVEYTVSIEKKNSTLDSLRIALMSDLHLGYIQGEKEVIKMVKMINELNPDLVVMAGDIFDGDISAIQNAKEIQKQFRMIKAKYGVYASLGNHDAGASYHEMLNFLEQSDIHLLLDETKAIDNAFLLSGRRDSSPIGNQGERRQALQLQRSDLPSMVIDHQSSNIREYGSETDLILSGHTHRGQLFPFHWITTAVYDVDYGYYRKDEHSPQVIVSSGIGTWGPPLRTSSNNEIVLVHIDFEK